MLSALHNVDVHGIVDEDGTRLFLEEILYSKKKYEQIVVSTESAIQFILQSHDVYKEGMLSHLA